MNLELMGALNELEKERGISREVLIKAIEDAIQSALRRSAQPSQNLRVDFDDRSGRVRVFARKAVVRQVVDPANEISLDEAQRINPRFEVDDVVEVELTLPDLGRIAAQTAKQVVVQRIREAERSRIYDEYHSREGDIITGIIRRIEHRNVYVDLGRTEAILPPSEQVSSERYAPGMRMKFYLAEVRKTTKGPQVVLSRSHPGLLKRLFELEVPEIHDGVVEIKAWAREPGHRSKIAVWSTDRNVDPVGACVGPRGARVQQVVKELRQEKVDVIAWDPDLEVFIANALQPARVLKVYLDPSDRSARVIVPDMQLSLAIGKEGQNARLAARLTGWRIDIKSEAQWEEVEREFQEKRQSQPPVFREAVVEPVEVVHADGEGWQPEQEGAAPAERVPAAAEEPAPAVQEPVPAEASAEAAAPEQVEIASPGEEEVEEEEEEPKVKVKGPGKVRRLKGFQRFERRRLEEELDEAEALPTLFGSDGSDAGQKAGAGSEPEQAPAGRAPEEDRQERSSSRGGGLSVRLVDLVKPQARALKEVSHKQEEPKAPEPAAPAATPTPGRLEQRRDAAEPRAAVREPAQPAGGQAGRQAGGQAGAQAPEQARGQAGGQAGRQAGGQAGGQAARTGEASRSGAPTAPAPDRERSPAEKEKEKKKVKVLKSLAELSMEDFGFSRPASKETGKGRGR